MNSQSNELILTLAMGFINHLSDTANNICNEKDKKTITPEHAIQAMRHLNLDAYAFEILGLKPPKGQKKINIEHKDVKAKIQEKGACQKKKKWKGLDDDNDKDSAQLNEEQEQLLNANGATFEDIMIEEEAQPQITVVAQYVNEEDGVEYCDLLVGYDENGQQVVETYRAADVYCPEGEEGQQQQEEEAGIQPAGGTGSGKKEVSPGKVESPAAAETEASNKPSLKDKYKFGNGPAQNKKPEEEDDDLDLDGEDEDDMEGSQNEEESKAN